MDLKINQLVKSYDQKVILDGINLDIVKSHVLALIGPSGSGKSTLLRLIAGLEPFDSGEILLNGLLIQEKDVNYRKKIGFVFQDHNLFSHLSILENIYIVLEKVHQKKRTEVAEEVHQLLVQFGLLEHKDKKPHQISGGQAQRASIVRALAIQPDIILLDEPTSALDPILTYEVLTGIQQLVEQKKEVILVTHEIGFAKQIADQIIYMDAGKIVEQGGKEIFDAPKTENLKGFLEKVLSFH